MKKEKAIKNEKKRGLRTSLAIHASLILLALIPFMKDDILTPEDEWHVVEIAFVNSDISSGMSSEAPKEVKELPEPEVEKEFVKKSVEASKPESAPVVTDDMESDVAIEENFSEEAEKVILDNEEVEVIEEEEVVEVVEEEIIEEVKTGLETTDGDEGEGDEGVHITGKELGEMDFEGDGVFGRKVIYRADVKKITEREGSVVINLCIDRLGRVTHAAFNKESSSIDEPEYVKRAMEVASDYKFEKDYTAPITQCGKLTFTFHIE